MPVDIFLDSNILIYAVEGGPASVSKKTKISRRLLRSPGIGISTQVIGEFYNTGA